RSLMVLCTAIADMPIADVRALHIVDVLRPIWRETPETASRTRGRIEQVFTYAIAAEYRPNDRGNPADGDVIRQLMGDQGHKVTHHAAVPFAALPALMAKLRANESLSARALEFLTLTAARTGDVIGATWGEIDGKVWSVSAARMKMKRDHRVPLSPRALEIMG